MTWIIRYSEIGLKGKNRKKFENQLKKNIESMLTKKTINFTKITKPRGRILVETNADAKEIKDVFGISSISPALECGFSIESIKETAQKTFPQGTFRVTCQRLDKKFPLKSIEVERELGAHIVEKNQAKVSLTKYQTEVGVEIIEGKSYVFYERIKGKGGLPIGTTGKVTCIANKEEDLLAAILMMKRGCEVLMANENIPTQPLQKFTDKIEVCKDEKYPLVYPYTLADNNITKKGIYPLIAYTQEEINKEFHELTNN